MRRALVAAALLLPAGCGGNAYLSERTAETGLLSEESVWLHASAGPLFFSRAQVIAGNDDAFRSKLALIEGAQRNIDAMYYIFADDYSSSVLAEALIAAARRGVRVRLLLDYHSNYKHLDLFSMMQRRAGGEDALAVRFYNRPTREMVKDAAYLTLGCGHGEKLPQADCAPAKMAEIDRRFAAETIDGRPAAELNISNLNVAGSGLFLSGMYAKNAGLMALAVREGQGIDPARFQRGGATSPEELESLKKIGQLYLRSRIGSPVARLAARIQLAMAFAFYGDVLDPVYAAFTGYLPAERDRPENADREWEHATDFMHHKLLLADGARLQLGGRNVEDSYHMRRNGMLGKYMFEDTDVVAELTTGGAAVTRSFETLWNFRPMVAAIDEIRLHAPNDYAANERAVAQAEAACAGEAEGAARDACLNGALARRAEGVEAREARRFREMQEKARRYRTAYRYRGAPDPSPRFDVDAGAALSYIENIPFRGAPEAAAEARSLGAVNGEEAESGKRIHGLWLAGLEDACRTATAARPQRVILHNAYFFPPSNLMRRFAEMVDGTLDCGHVTVTVLTNSIATTDLKVVNLFGRHAAKAFAEYYRDRRHPVRGARFEYYEYLGEAASDSARGQLSLHTKVSVLGDSLIVGSANADLRSYMMDSNNGLFIRRASALTARYTAHVNALLADGARTSDITRIVADTPRAAMLAEDRATLRAEMARYRAERFIDAGQADRVEARMIGMLNRAYDLARAVLAGGPGGRAAEEQFDRLFKPI
jgi:phosphatidylserine/phosphatidylglycerophosphate/cardiolipin synthase-like enzyme